MLESLSLRHFTVFDDFFGDKRLKFSHLNVIVGENGTGKSHLLKLVYALTIASHIMKDSPRQGKEEMQRVLADKMVRVFQPDSLGRLVSRQRGRGRCDLAAIFDQPNEYGFSFSFAGNSKTEVRLDDFPREYLPEAPVFIPTREILSIFPGFAAALETRELAFDETYLDLAKRLALPPRKGAKPSSESGMLSLLEEILGGKIHLERGRFYLLSEDSGTGKLEIPLVAEGIRKVGMLTYLLLNGSLKDRGILIWDEPETNCHPRMMVSLAKALVLMAQRGTQIFLATHSLFFLRELAIIRWQGDQSVPFRYFGLERTKEGVLVDQADSPEELDPLGLLDEDIQQTERYFEASGEEKNALLE